MNKWSEKMKMRLPAILLLAASLLFWGFYDRYELAGPVWRETGSLAEASSLQGDVTEQDGRFSLSIPEGGKSAKVRFVLENGCVYEAIRVRARIRTEGVVVGKYYWRCARVVLVQYDRSGKWIPGPHGVVSKDGTEPWSDHDDVFEIVSEAARAALVIEHTGRAGTAEFEGLVAEPVRLKPFFHVWRWGFAGLWVWMGVLYFRRCRMHVRRLKVLILLNAAAIILGSLMPGEWLEEIAERAKVCIVEMKKPSAAPSEKTVPKKAHAAGASVVVQKESRQMDHFNLAVGGVHRLGHFGLFATLCFLVYCSAAFEQQHKIYFLKVGFDVFLFAIITESLQHLTLDRTAGWRDLLVDVYGMGAAFLVFVCVLPVIRRIRV